MPSVEQSINLFKGLSEDGTSISLGAELCRRLTDRDIIRMTNDPRFQSLTHIHLDSCPLVTDSVLFHLAKLPQLKFAESQITGTFGRAFEKAHPSVKIIWGQDNA